MAANSTRRELLIGVAALGSMSITRAASLRTLGSNGRINVAVVGLGGRGNNLLDYVLHRIEERGDVQVIALCDVYQKRLNASRDRAARHGQDPKIYTIHQELLSRQDLDAVFIATPDHWHGPISLLAMERGLDVYCEKPMTHTLDEARTVAHTAKKGDAYFRSECNRHPGTAGTRFANWFNPVLSGK